MSESLDQPKVEIIKETIRQMIAGLGFLAKVEVLTDEKDRQLPVVAISAEEDLSLLIGKNGQNLKAVEHIARLAVFKKEPGLANFVLDINDYRRSKAKHIVQEAAEAAGRVRASKKAEALLPMSAYERRLVHVELASYPDLETESIGEEPQRRVVIRPLIL